MSRLTGLKLAFGLGLGLQATWSFASGFALIEQSASGQGLSYAGAAANAEDASVMWFNPAGLALIKGDQLVGAMHIIKPQLAFSDGGSYSSSAVPGVGGLLELLGVAGGPVSGSGDDGATLAVVPNFYWKKNLGAVDIGFGLNVPYGSHLVYKDNWVGRYQAVETDLKTINLNPAIAARLTPWLAFGAGANVQYVDLVMTQKMDNNLLLNGGAADGDADLTADSLGYGYNLGFMLMPTDSTTIGLSYRSKVEHNAKGKIKYSGITDPLYSMVNVQNGTVNAASDVSLPATAMFSIKQEVGSKLAFLADATWTKWTDYDELVISFDSGQEDLNSRQSFQDSWRYSVGAIYKATSNLTLRSGVAIDHSPVTAPENRSPRTPDSERRWVSIGMGYRFIKSMQLDMAYSHLIGEDADVDYTTDDIHYLVGEYKATVDIFSAQLVWNY
ncbi:OmpP1/FadL family transporter [Thiomicrorhabdus heinhorstiae]|uniref:Transporter n=1 Tax=Thiomicrorhabdus heinhorstiae TaxID=2748010 RepID=A0ABS0BTN4_9GAMM|nr:outer membrane protein transport protein [Thiomicrorhabdus heinhorstiae]MBF6057210.1 transporter [Thiomicrorhabdus heinhorstiae]